MADPPRYDFDEIDLDSGNVHADVVNFVVPGSRVLELGPATGYMSHTSSVAAARSWGSSTTRGWPNGQRSSASE